jgi:hypothetical protein
MLFAVSGANNALAATTVLSLAVYVLLLGALFFTSPRFLCVGNVFGVFWAIWFPARLLVIQADRHSIALHPVVSAASDGELVVVWLLSLFGFAAFAVGVLVVRRRRSGVPPASLVPNLRRSAFLLIAVAGLVASWVQLLAHVQSGILGEAANVFLLGIAGAAFVDARDRRWSWAVPVLVGAGVLLGTVAWFKGNAMAPVLAWAIGSVLGGLQITRLRILLAVVIGLGAFAGVQGQRLTGGSNPITGARAALFDYDLTTGLPEHQPNAGAAASNLFAGVMNRTAGADGVLVVRAKTPSTIPFQRGRTLWQPAATVVPGARVLLDGDMSQLSLGGYFATQFWSVDPAGDRSAQAITMPGDFYLNFGVLGVALGMLGVGLLIGLVERRFPSGTAFGAGVLAYAGLPLVTVDSNVAYALVTAGMRLGVVFVVLLLVDFAPPRRRSLTQGATVGGCTPP